MNKLPSKLKLSLCLTAVGLMSAFTMQARTIYGIVLDETGQPLVGATVRELPAQKTNAVHAVTVDINGHFRLDVEDDSNLNYS